MSQKHYLKVELDPMKAMGALDVIFDAGAIEYWDGNEYANVVRFTPEEMKAAGQSTSIPWIKSFDLSYQDPEKEGVTHTKTITLDSICEGVVKMMEPTMSLRADYKAEIFKLAIEGRLDEIDSDQVDYIMQALLFGRLIYG